jgi:biopolymer transport protein ExbD
MIETAKISPQPNIMVRPDKSARYEGVAFVLANSQRRGLQKLAIIGGEQFR